MSVFSLHGFVKNLDKKSGRIALNKDYGHYFRAILCLFCPDFPQNPCSTDFFRLNALQELGGWADYSMVLRYAHLSSDHLKDYAKNVVTENQKNVTYLLHAVNKN